MFFFQEQNNQKSGFSETNTKLVNKETNKKILRIYKVKKKPVIEK